MSTPRRNAKFEWQSAFIESGLTGNTGFVGLLMSTFDNGDGRGFFISSNRIAEMTGLNERTARAQIKTLRTAGWIKRTSKGGNQGGKPRASSYALTVPQAAQPEASAAQPERVSSQPASTALVVDQAQIDQLLVDPLLLKDGDELPASIVIGLDWEYQEHFSPFDAEDGMMRYERPVQEPAPPTDSRPLWKQRQNYEEELRREGLDENGEPLNEESSGRNSRSSRY